MTANNLTVVLDAVNLLEVRFLQALLEMLFIMMLDDLFPDKRHRLDAQKAAIDDAHDGESADSLLIFKHDILLGFFTCVNVSVDPRLPGVKIYEAVVDFFAHCRDLVLNLDLLRLVFVFG